MKKSLLVRGFAQGGVTIEVRRQPTLQTFGVEYRAMFWVVITHGRERFDKLALRFKIEIRPRCEHAMVVRRRRPYLTQAAFRHEVFAPHGIPKWTADSPSVCSPVENCTYYFHLAGAGITMFTNIAVEAQRPVITALVHPFLL